MVGKEEGVERGEYVIGIAIILAALLVSGTAYFGMANIEKAVSNLKLSVPAAAAAAQPAAQQPAAQQPAAQQPAAAQPLTPVKITLPDYSQAHLQGGDGAKVMFVIYSDYQCPYCGKVEPSVAQVQADYKVTYVFRNYPLPPSMHPDAQKAAEAAECAAKQGKFWPMHDKLFASQSALGVGYLKSYASSLGLDVNAFNACLDGNETTALVKSQQQEGAQLGVGGTPSFFIYFKTATGAAGEAKLQKAAAAISAKYAQYGGIQMSLIQVDGAGSGLSFAAALPYEDFKTMMDAFN